MSIPVWLWVLGILAAAVVLPLAAVGAFLIFGQSWARGFW